MYARTTHTLRHSLNMLVHTFMYHKKGAKSSKSPEAYCFNNVVIESVVNNKVESRDPVAIDCVELTR